MGKWAALAVGMGLGPKGCTGRFAGSLSQDGLTSEEFDERFLKYWDPIFGPPLRWSAIYGGPSNFEGHLRGGATPGVDYDVPMNTPLVPMMASYLRQATKDRHGSLYVLLVNKHRPSYRISYGHLNRVLVDRSYFLKGDLQRAAEEGVKPLMRDRIVALSGNSGMGLLKNWFVHPPHLHITLYYLNLENRTLAYLDPEKFGLDGGRPVFWDGETNLDVEPERRIEHLESTLNQLEKELQDWEGTSELEALREILRPYGRLLQGKKGKALLESEPFLELREHLKRVTLQEKRFLPGTRPYSLMLKVVGYSTEESQEIILTLPFVAPGLEMGYKRTTVRNPRESGSL
ncbi:MAG: M23 family metallopeptidase [Desulfobacterota bacterium]|nr:M23 family metallopeptidase [Thermodesulfobacteriota bacterium]